MGEISGSYSNVNQKIRVFWVVMPCRCVGSLRLFERPYQMNLQNQLADLEEEGCTIIRYMRNYNSKRYVIKPMDTSAI